MHITSIWHACTCCSLPLQHHYITLLACTFSLGSLSMMGLAGRRKRLARVEPEKPKCALMMNNADAAVIIMAGMKTHTSYAIPMGGMDGSALRRLGSAKSRAKHAPIMGGKASRDLSTE